MRFLFYQEELDRIRRQSISSIPSALLPVDRSWDAARALGSPTGTNKQVSVAVNYEGGSGKHCDECSTWFCAGRDFMCSWRVVILELIIGCPLINLFYMIALRQLKAMESVVAGALRREKAAEENTERLAAEIEQLKRLVGSSRKYSEACASYKYSRNHLHLLLM